MEPAANLFPGGSEQPHGIAHRLLAHLVVAALMVLEPEMRGVVAQQR